MLDLNYEVEPDGSISITNYKSAGADCGRIEAGIIAADLADIPNLTIIERGKNSKVLTEQSIQQTGLISSETAKEVGKLVGADAIVIGDLTDYLIWDALGSFGSTISFSIGMIDVQSGKVLLNASISRVRSLVDSFANVQLISKELVDGFRNR